MTSKICSMCLETSGQSNNLIDGRICPVHGNVFIQRMKWWGLVVLLAVDVGIMIWISTIALH